MMSCVQKGKQSKRTRYVLDYLTTLVTKTKWEIEAYWVRWTVGWLKTNMKRTFILGNSFISEKNKTGSPLLGRTINDNQDANESAFYVHIP